MEIDERWQHFEGTKIPFSFQKNDSKNLNQHILCCVSEEADLARAGVRGEQQQQGGHPGSSEDCRARGVGQLAQQPILQQAHVHQPLPGSPGQAVKLQ
eukprot:scaffold247618_cov39-Prasinocladus_malaysianus.AAC.1